MLNSLFVFSLQMEMDADDKRHRTRSKGICTDTHAYAQPFRVTFTPPTQTHTYTDTSTHIYTVHTPLHKSQTVTLQLPFLTALSVSLSLFVRILQKQNQKVHILKALFQNEISHRVTSNPTKQYILQNENKLWNF